MPHGDVHAGVWGFVSTEKALDAEKVRAQADARAGYQLYLPATFIVFAAIKLADALQLPISQDLTTASFILIPSVDFMRTGHTETQQCREVKGTLWNSSNGAHAAVGHSECVKAMAWFGSIAQVYQMYLTLLPCIIDLPAYGSQSQLDSQASVDLCMR